MEVLRDCMGMFGTNVYFLVNEESRECIIVDPADRADKIQRFLKEKQLTAKLILLTHGHFDHIYAVPELKAALELPVWAGSSETALLADPRMNSSAEWASPVEIVPDRLLTDLEICEAAGLSFQVLETPGHTAGSCCYYFDKEKVLISGDTLFYGSYGRTDLPTGSDEDIVRSVHRLLSGLPEETTVYPGHMRATSIGRERRINPLAFVQ